MHPILFQIGPFSVHTYGFFIALGVLAGLFLARREAKRLELDPDNVVDACFYIVVAAIVGSRVFYVLTNWDVFAAAPLDVFKIWEGGLVFYGGLIGALAMFGVYLKMAKLPFGKMADIGAVCVPLGHTFGRLGCFSAGCCYGKVCQHPWAVTFRHPDSLAPLYVPLHPTQLYCAFSNLSIFLLIFSLRRFKRYDGQLFWIYVAAYGINRSIIEFFRGDFRGAVFWNTFSIAQVIGISSAAFALIMLAVLGHRAALRKNA